MIWLRMYPEVAVRILSDMFEISPSTVQREVMDDSSIIMALF